MHRDRGAVAGPRHPDFRSHFACIAVQPVPYEAARAGLRSWVLAGLRADLATLGRIFVGLFADFLALGRVLAGLRANYLYRITGGTFGS